MQALELAFSVQQAALGLDSERGEGVVVVEYRCISVYGSFQLVFELPNLREEALGLVKTSAFHVVRVYYAVAELLCALCSAAVAEIEQALAAVGHCLPAPELGLTGAGQVAREVVTLRAHYGFSYPEVLALEAAHMVQAEGDLRRRQRMHLPAPDGVVVVGCLIQQSGERRVVEAFGESAAGKVVNNQSARHDVPYELDLCIGKAADVLSAEALPIQPERRIVRGYRNCGQGDLFKGVVLLAPEHRSPGGVQA